jgi:mono/diheme cytochrome c family protein/cytochrome c oxidase subunit IV
MATSTADAHGADGHEEHKHHSWVFYTVIAVVLAILTAIEVGPLFGWFELNAAALIALSIAKFFLVVAFFMHLWDDPPVYTQMFVAPLIGGTLMVTVLMVLFHTFRPAAYVDSLAIQERYGDAFNGQCASWLRSHKTGRLYCASAYKVEEVQVEQADGSVKTVKKRVHIPLDKDRVAYLGVQTIDADGDGQLDPIEMPIIEEKDDGGLADAYAALGTDQERIDFLVEEGKTVYENNCQSCHQADGKGVPGAFPPLANSDYPDYQDPEGHIKIVLNGLQGRIVVNDVEYNGAMQAFSGLLSDAEIAAVVTYERNAWGNDDGWVKPGDVASLR